MSTPKTKRTPAETWDAIMKAAEDDAAEQEMERVLAMSDAEVDDELAAAGFDPVKVRADGAALAARLLARRDAETAPAQAAHLERARLAQIRARRGKLDRSALLARIHTVKNDPRLPAPLAVQYRNRGTDEASDDELEDTLDALEALLEHHDESRGAK
jgi:hypothetical protein